MPRLDRRLSPNGELDLVASPHATSNGPASPHTDAEAEAVEIVERRLSTRSISGHRSGVDPFRAEEIERYRQQSPRDRLLEALGVMEDGIAMKRANLVRRHPELDDSAIDAKLQAWLDRDE